MQHVDRLAFEHPPHRLVDERIDELHVSANSYVLSDNVGRTQGNGADRALGRLRDYLTSARERFPAFETLLIIDPTGRAVTGSPLIRLANAVRVGRTVPLAALRQI